MIKYFYTVLLLACVAGLSSCDSGGPLFDRPWYANKIAGTENRVLMGTFVDDTNVVVLYAQISTASAGIGSTIQMGIGDLNVETRSYTERGLIAWPSANSDFTAANGIENSLKYWLTCVDVANRPGTKEVWINYFGSVIRLDEGKTTYKEVTTLDVCSQGNVDTWEVDSLMAFDPSGDALYLGSYANPLSKYTVSAAGDLANPIGFAETTKRDEGDGNSAASVVVEAPGVCAGGFLGDDLWARRCGGAENQTITGVLVIRSSGEVVFGSRDTISRRLDFEDSNGQGLIHMLPVGVPNANGVAFADTCLIDLNPNGAGVIYEHTVCRTSITGGEQPEFVAFSPNGDTIVGFNWDFNGAIVFSEDGSSESGGEIDGNWCYANGGHAYQFNADDTFNRTLFDDTAAWSSVTYNKKGEEVDISWEGNTVGVLPDTTLRYHALVDDQTLIIRGPNNLEDADEQSGFGVQRIEGATYNEVVYRPKNGNQCTNYVECGSATANCAIIGADGGVISVSGPGIEDGTQ